MSETIKITPAPPRVPTPINAQPPRPRLPSLASPYKGLMPYTENDAQFFFGRDTDTDIISANLIASRLTLLYGPSGVGKSSVLRAGVVNSLHERMREDLSEGREAEFIVVYFNNWKDDPVLGLLDAVSVAISQSAARSPQKAVHPISSPRLLETLQAAGSRFEGYLLVILDQFEEFFLYHGAKEGNYSFVNEFPRALNEPNLRTNFMLSFREDALAKLDFFQGRIPNLFKNYLRIKHLDLEAARQAIVKPLARYNALHPAVPPVTIEPALVDAVLSQVQVGRVVLGETGRGSVLQSNPDAQIETPYLQLVLTRLWERERMAGSNALHLATLEQLGGAEEIVRAHLQHAIDDLSPPEQAIAASVFDRLVTPSGTKIAQTARDLARYARVSEQDLGIVLERLAGGQNRILRPVAPSPDLPDAPRYEIFHDVLSGAILEWRAKYEKVQEQHKLQAELERERAEANRETALKNEQARARRTKYALWGTLSAVVLLLGLALFAFQQRADAINSTARAETQAARLASQGTAVAKQAANAQELARGLSTALAQSKDPANQALVATAGAVGTSAVVVQTQAANAQDVASGLSTALAHSDNPTNQALVATAGAVGTSAVAAQELATSTPTKASAPSPTDISSRVSNDGSLMIFVPAGEFPMGAHDDAPDVDSNQSPLHTVALDGFWIDEHEVTNEQFERFVVEIRYKTEAEELGSGWVPDPDWVKRDGASWLAPQGPGSSIQSRQNHPVVQVSWNDANAYCGWAGKRLPTEAEWEKAARGTDGRFYPWGPEFDTSRANTNKSGNWGTRPVGSFPQGASPYKVLDMSGNVWEWVEDRYGEHFYSNPVGPNPHGPTEGERRVLRGGAWVDNEIFARSIYRLHLEPFYSGAAVGFRCAQSN